MAIILIAAVAENRVIGNKGKMPWYIREDMIRFQRLTRGHAAVMGSATFASMMGAFVRMPPVPLPGRTNIVLTRSPDAFTTRWGMDPLVRVVMSLEEGLRRGAEVHPDVYVIGGAQVYAQALPFADRLELTHVHRAHGGDTYFPVIDPAQWFEKERQDHEGFSFVTYERNP